jgi:hypothetical protein
MEAVLEVNPADLHDGTIGLAVFNW